MAMDAAITASPVEPPACSQRDSRPWQLNVPAEVVAGPLERLETVVGAPTEAEPLPLSLPASLLGAACLAWYPPLGALVTLGVVAGASEAGSV